MTVKELIEALNRIKEKKRLESLKTLREYQKRLNNDS